MGLKTYFRKAWLPIYLAPIALVVILAYFDNIGRKMFLSAANSGQVYQAMEPLYMQLFHGLVYTGVLGMTAVVYYYRRDLRDALAYLVFSLATVYSGIWDVLYYWFQGRAVPEVLSHLSGKPPGSVALAVNDGVVTAELLYANAVVFLVLGLGVAASIRYGTVGDFLD